jgi:hypothetical protein
MASELHVDAIKHSGGTSALTIDSSGNVNIPGSIIQVVQATTATQSTHSSTTYSDTGLTVDITPKFNTSKVLVMAKQKGFRLDPGGTTSEVGGSIGLLRGSTFIHKPGPSTGHHSFYLDGANGYSELEVTFLDSPSTTSATTYKTQCATYTARTVYCQQGGNFTSVIIAMEVAQ